MARAMPAHHVRTAPALALPGTLAIAGVLLGIGLGGFVDGILLHQVLQWHHMLTATGHHSMETVGGLETNTLWDGLFHSATWVATAAGIGVLWHGMPLKHQPGGGRALAGLMAVGWGAFNLVEGLIDHHLLGIHHVRDDVETKWPWDVGFLVFGALLVVGGLAMARRRGTEREIA